MEKQNNEALRVALTGMYYPFNTDKNIAIKKQMLEIDVLKKLSDKLDDFEEFDDDDDEEFDEGDEKIIQRKC